MKRRIKQILSTILVAIMLVGVMPITGFAEEGEETFGYLEYEISDGEVSITGCDTSISGELTIPETIEGYPVTSIGLGAFEKCTDLISVTISNNVTSIADIAFSGCNRLASVIIPDNVASIGDGVFSYCTDLTSIMVSKNNKIYDSRNNCNAIIETGINRLIAGCKNTVIPNDIAIIGYRAFDGCTDLTSITIPNSVTYIDATAFDGCTGLTSIVIPDSVTLIGGYAFRNCTNLKNISMPNYARVYSSAFFNTAYYNNDSNWENDILYIGAYLIDAKENLSGSRIIKNGTQFIACEAFRSCKYLTDITISNSVIRIGYDAFASCSQLTNVTIPDSVIYIEFGAFEECTGLTSITIPNSVTFIDANAFSKCSSLTSIVIPDSVTLIGGGAFGNCTGLKSVTIPDGVTSISNYAFYNCNSLTDVYYSGSKQSWNNIAIGNGNDYLKNATIHFNVSVHTHTLNHVTVPSTCKVAGMEYDICTECGETLNEKTLPLAAHKWSNWTVVKEPTATTEGIEKRTCSVCGKDETQSIEKFNGIRDSETGVEIIYNDEYSDGTELKVEEKFSGKSFQLIGTAYGKTNTAIYDISTYKDGVKVQPNREITVRVPLPKGFSANKVFVCYVDSTNGKVTKIPCEVKDGYVVFKTDHFSEYAIIEQLACVKSVSVSDITLNYKKSAAIKPTVKADDGAKYTIKYESSNTKVATVDKNGKVYGAKKGMATITCTVTDSGGNTVQDTCKVNVKYSFGQWLIVILLFGWIWY